MPLDLFRIARQTRSPADIKAWQEAGVGNVCHHANAATPRHAAAARDDVLAAALLALVDKTTAILAKDFETEGALQAYLRRLVVHVAMQEIDSILHVGWAPALKTKLKRVASGRDALKATDPRRAAEVKLRRVADNCDPIEEAIRQDFFLWAKDRAYQLAADDPALTRAMKLAEGDDHHFSSGLPSITAIAKAVGMQRETLRDRFRRLGRQLAALDPEAGVEYVGKAWEAAAKFAGSDFDYVGEDRIAA